MREPNVWGSRESGTGRLQKNARRERCQLCPSQASSRVGGSYGLEMCVRVNTAVE